MIIADFWSSTVANFWSSFASSVSCNSQVRGHRLLESVVSASVSSSTSLIPDLAVLVSGYAATSVNCDACYIPIWRCKYGTLSKARGAFLPISRRGRHAICSQLGGVGYVSSNASVPRCVHTDNAHPSTYDRTLYFQFRLSDFPPHLAAAHALPGIPIRRQLLQYWAGCNDRDDREGGRIVDMGDDADSDNIEPTLTKEQNKGEDRNQLSGRLGSSCR